MIPTWMVVREHVPHETPKEADEEYATKTNEEQVGSGSEDGVSLKAAAIKAQQKSTTPQGLRGVLL